MDRVERHIVVKDSNIDNLCFLSKNLYNYVNYILRDSFIKTKKLPSQYALINQFTKENQVDFRALPSNTSQQIIFALYKSWTSFFKALKSYKQDKSKFNRNPQLPKYKHKIKGRNIVVFTYVQVQVKDGYINFPKKTNIKPLKTNVDKLKQVRIIPQATCYVIEVVYEKEPTQNDVNKDSVLSIDLGLNNLATCINNVGEKPFIVNGRILKSINQYYNKVKAKYQSYVGDKGWSNRLSKLTHKRNNKVRDYLHKTSRFVVDYCLQYKIGTIIIGNNKEWKQNINIGKRNNQNFVSIPFATLIQQIQYKAKDNGIIVQVVEESYTSKVDHFALETMEHHTSYLGKRVKRGLFQSSKGFLINADCNGAIGILRKALGDLALMPILNIGVAETPVRVNPLTNICLGALNI